ncbi:unnamed protein product [Prorocentrum cordatum]|uniref:Altered inheritance of mitochondria protein 24, mitochondrial n=1 Tax=Prorocentrum cordatum TaxID=2364126 RepID=A0ABN9PX72_9DINO|nr:unnamed protein product [Polarella glacialis]
MEPTTWPPSGTITASAEEWRRASPPSTAPTTRRSRRWLCSIENFGYVASEPISGSDCRLFVDGELVYITRGFSTVHLEGRVQDHQGHHGPDLQERRGSMELRLDGGALWVSFTSDRELSQSDDRNFGLLKHGGKLQVLRWPGETMDVRAMRLAPPQKPRADATDEELAAFAGFHNSVNPLEPWLPQPGGNSFACQWGPPLWESRQGELAHLC